MKQKLNIRLVARILFNSICDWSPISALPRVDLIVVANDADRPCSLKGKYFSPNADLIAYVSRKTSIGIARILDKKTSPITLLPTLALSGHFCRALIFKHVTTYLKRCLIGSNNYVFSGSEYRVWRKIIKVITPQAILAINPSRELCHAASEFGIACIEIQHGIIYPSHPYYSAGRSVEPLSWLPSAYVVWTEYSKNVISEIYSNKPTPPIFILGNVYQTCVKFSSSLYELAFSQAPSLSRELSSSNRPIILITLSWGMNELGMNLISETYINLINNTSGSYRWIIRLHPAQISGHRKFEYAEFIEKYLPRLPPEVFSDVYNESPLPLLALSVKLHLTEISSSVIDLACMNIPSIVTHPLMKESNAIGVYLFDKHVTYMPRATAVELNLCIENMLLGPESDLCPPEDLLNSGVELQNLLDYLHC
jgi:hypothetical protein